MRLGRSKPAKAPAKAPQKRASFPVPPSARIGDGYAGGRRTLSQAESDALINGRLGLPPPEPPGGIRH